MGETLFGYLSLVPSCILVSFSQLENERISWAFRDSNSGQSLGFKSTYDYHVPTEDEPSPWEDVCVLARYESLPRFYGPEYCAGDPIRYKKFREGKRLH